MADTKQNKDHMIMDKDNHIQVSVENSAENAARACAQRLSDLLTKHATKKVGILVSGGSALAVLDEVSLQNIGPQVTICIVDERFAVALENQNFYQLKQSPFIQKAVAAGARIADTDLSAQDSLSKAGEKFARALAQIASSEIVITVLGIGPDGHTAGIMPFPESKQEYEKKFCDDKSLAIGYDAGEKNQFPLRVTASSTFLKSTSDHTLVFAVGSQKKTVLKEILTTKKGEHIFPARIFHDMRDVVVFTDQDGLL